MVTFFGQTVCVIMLALQTLVLEINPQEPSGVHKAQQNLSFNKLSALLKYHIWDIFLAAWHITSQRPIQPSLVSSCTFTGNAFFLLPVAP